jgi:hypothetical protein
LHDIYPLYSLEFYQKYWKPIVEKLNHFYITDADTLIIADQTSLSDIPKNFPLSREIKGWQVENKRPQEVSLSFKKGGDKALWMFEASIVKKLASAEIKEVSKYTEQDYLGGIFRCTDPKLKSIFNQTGEVIQIIPLVDNVEVDIDFGRGIGVVRLTEDKIEKVL